MPNWRTEHEWTDTSEETGATGGLQATQAQANRQFNKTETQANRTT